MKQQPAKSSSLHPRKLKEYRVTAELYKEPGAPAQEVWTHTVQAHTREEAKEKAYQHAFTSNLRVKTMKVFYIHPNRTVQDHVENIRFIADYREEQSKLRTETVIGRRRSFYVNYRAAICDDDDNEARQLIAEMGAGSGFLQSEVSRIFEEEEYRALAELDDASLEDVDF